MERRRVCLLAGPTASGKTDASLAVAEALGMEIVSADSMQVYRRMDIGTAKATPRERARVPHHMIDIAEPWEIYTAARYRGEGRAALEDIFARGKTPLVVGGTGLYISALVDDMNFARAQGNEREREAWEAYLARRGNLALHAELAKVDSRTAKRLHPNDTRRVIRALEVYALTGKPMSETTVSAESPYDLRMVCLTLEREKLCRRIDERVRNMVRNGLVDEAKRLYAEKTETAAQALGYKELFAVFRGKATLDEAFEQIRRGTRRCAKRQLTWFRRDERFVWLDADVPDLARSLTEIFQNG